MYENLLILLAICASPLMLLLFLYATSRKKTGFLSSANRFLNGLAWTMWLLAAFSVFSDTYRPFALAVFGAYFGFLGVGSWIRSRISSDETGGRLTTAVGLAIGIVLLFVIGAGPRDITGSWVKRSGASDVPDLLSIKRNSNSVTFRYFEQGGLTSVTLLCDGAEHNLLSSFYIATTYRAECSDESVRISKRSVSKSVPEFKYEETWSLSNQGRRLLTSQFGQETATYERPSWLQKLLVASP